MEIRLGQKCAIKESIVDKDVFLDDWLAAVGAEEYADNGYATSFLYGLFVIEGCFIIPFNDFEPLVEECHGYNQNNPQLVYIRSIDEKDKSFEIPLAWVRLF